MIVRMHRCTVPNVDEDCMMVRNEDWTLCLVMTVPEQAQPWFAGSPMVYADIDWTHSGTKTNVRFLKRLEDQGWPESEPPDELGLALDPPTRVQ